jgi:1-pyrroline-5-carboxylate dehydrogenase
VNEPILGYLKGSKERNALEKELKRQKSVVRHIPLVIGGKEVKTGDVGQVVMPHDHGHVLATYEKAGKAEVEMAVQSALEAQKEWRKVSLDERMGIFMKASELLSSEKWRSRLNAATMLGQSKNVFQAEIDSACEMIDFLRFNVYYAASILASEQPLSGPGVWNRLAYRPLEGFVYAVTPFNFTAIGGNLVTSPAMLGNVVLWKPSDYAILSNYYMFELLQEAGVPAGVINWIPGDASRITSQLLAEPSFAGIHYTGSTTVFKSIYKQIASSLETYRSYPRIVGETGGKGFVFAHHSADLPSLATALVRGAFEYAGQKCSAASRAYIPKSIWPSLLSLIKDQMGKPGQNMNFEVFKAEATKLGSHKPLSFERAAVGNPELKETFVNAVIHQSSFNRCKEHIEMAKASPNKAQIVLGGGYDDSVGFFVQPTIITTNDPKYHSLVNEIFGPILTVFIYEDEAFEETLKICDESTEYALTGAIFAQDRYALITADSILENSAGNYYINDKPTGAVVGQQPFGGGRGSGTNDKAGSHLNLLRWLSPRTIKETFVPPTDILYPYMTEL